MKTLITFFAFIACFYFVYSQSKPIVLTKAQMSSTNKPDTLFSCSSDANVETPIEGEDLLWNYLNLKKNNSIPMGIEEYSDTAFPDCQYYAPELFEYLTNDKGFNYDAYYQFNDSYYGVSDLSVRQQIYPIGNLTGNLKDTLLFPEQKLKLETPLFNFKFPETFESSMAFESKYVFDFILSVTNYGINNAKGQKIVKFTVKDTIVGWGTLAMGLKNTDFNSGFEVLLSKKKVERLDSFFLGGQPAPPLLLSAFGISQGSVKTYYYYSFYSWLTKSYLARIVYSDSSYSIPTGIYINTLHQTISDVETKVESNNLTIYPNPCFNRTLNLKISDSRDLKFEVFDALGNRIMNNMILSGQSKVDIKLPEYITSGLYFYRASDNLSGIIYSGKFLVVD